MRLRSDGPPTLSVIRGLTYTEQGQVFNRWFLPTYQTAFRWTGNRSDAEDATTWVFANAIRPTHLPELVSVVDDMVADATLDAVSRHWCDRYGVVPFQCAEIYAFEAGLSGRSALTLEALAERLSPEMRLVIVLRFLRKRTLSAIATQLGVPAWTANVLLYTALSQVATGMKLDAAGGDHTQAGEVAAFVDDLIGRRRPVRFEASPPAWAALLAATHLQGAVAGNDLPSARFARSLEETLETSHRNSHPRRHVTNLRIWSA